MPGSAQDPLAGARTGQRWVLRVRLDDGSATDVVGWLDRLDPAEALVGDARGATHRVRRDRVLLARRAPAAASGPPPGRTSAAQLERIAARGWHAAAEPLGEWLLRAAGGFTARANSCLAVGDPGLPTREAADRIVRHAASYGIPPRAQVIRGSAEEAALRGLGWDDTHHPADVLAVRLADLLGSTEPPAGVGLEPEPGPGWWAAHDRSRPGADAAAARAVLGGVEPPRIFAAVPGAAGEVVAIGRGHLADGWLGVAALWTDPAWRGRGLAGSVLSALGHWAARRGGRYGYLQVASANSSAAASYAKLGFRPHHSYVYLGPPGGYLGPTGRSVEMY